ncbi:uncharacterized protein JCM10292_002138 [Rhodotorula paludigena]|uniref:uncharacterized protein n=1 Tax=Rhodotorula paludigena TaxID=86838 RepID=UPI0031822D70
MAIFKSKHKKNEGSASNRADATGLTSPQLGGGGGGPPGSQFGSSTSSKPGSLGGSVGRSGIPVPGGGSGGAAGLYASTGSNGPGGMASALHASLPYGNGAAPQQPQPGQYGPAGPASSAPPQQQSHTVLYPWSQRRVSLLPSQLLPPPSPSDSPSAPLTPLLGPTSPLPFPRYGHSVNPVATASPTGDLYIFGGLVQNAVKNDLFVVQANPTLPPGSSPSPPPGAGPHAPLAVGLIEMRGEVPGPRVGHASVGVGNVLIVWGGDTKSRPEEKQDDGLYLLNLSTRDWTRVKTVGRAPEGRYGHAAAMVGSRFFVFGGQTDDGGFKNDLCWFDLQKLKQGQPSWSFVEYRPGQVVPPPRTGHTCVTHGDCLYIFGGTDGQYHYNDTWQYDLASGQWTELACIGYIPVPREGHAATLVDDVMYVFGGRGVDGKDLEDLAAFKISNHRWFMFQNMGPAPSGRSGHAMATYGSKVIVLGGESYTSTRADDPSCIHVLDTTKIKYPPDSSRPAQQQQKPLQSSSPPPSQLPQPSSGIPVKRKSSIPISTSSPPRGGAGAEDDLRARAASPTGSARGLKSSLGPAAGAGIAQAIMNGSSTSASASPVPGSPSRSAAAGESKIARPPGAGVAPSRPARPDDAEAFRASPAPPASAAAAVAAERTRSPTNGAAAAVGTDPRLRQASGGGAELSDAPADAFYYRSSPSALPAEREKDANLARLERREAWLVEALRRARAAGFDVQSVPDSAGRGRMGEEEGDKEVEEVVAGPRGEEEEGEGEKGVKDEVLERDVEVGKREQKLRDALVEMKQELAKARTAMSEQAASTNDRFVSSDRARLAALQEAAYYRAKLAALESGSPSDVSKLERDRSASLEQKLAEAVAARAALEVQVNKLEQDAAHHASSRESTDELHRAALARADEAEQNHARALAELAALQTRAGEHERGVSDHQEQLASVRSAHSTLEGEHSRLKEQVAEHEASVANWLATLEASEAALTAAHTRNNELSSAWDKASSELQQQQARVAELEHQLETMRVERDAAQAKAEGADGLLRSTREAHDKSQALASGGLAQLLAVRRGPQAVRNVSRGMGDADDDAEVAQDEPSPVHAERLRAVESEVAAVKQLHADAQSKHQALSTDLAAAREREAGLHVQLTTLRTQLATVQAQHASALEELGSHKALVSTHENTARETSRARDAAEVKAGLLRSLLADHGLAAPSEDELASRFPTMTGTESPDQLAKRVLELEGELEARMRQKQQLEERVREHEGESGRLRDELERAKSGGGEVQERATKAAEDLEALQSRHQQLEATHLKAVQYVKGTEKMLRRMKEELTRYKERCEELESPERQAEIDGLRQQVQELRHASDSSTRETEQLQQRMATLQSEYQQTIRQQQDEALGKVQQLETELNRLDAQLEKANHDLEETLAVNASLNKELQAALKSPTSPRLAGGAPAAEDLSRLQAELEQAENKAEWLKRENATLEQRCRSAESKIAILLDHMEGVQDDQYSTNGSPRLGSGGEDGTPQHQQHEWQQQPRGDSPDHDDLDFAGADQPQRRL